MQPKPTDVVVTGIGVLAACGIGADSFWHSVRDGKSGVRSLEHRDDGGPKPPAAWRTSEAAGCWVGGPIVGFDAAQFVRPRKALKVMGRELQTSFAASQMAIDQAGIAGAMETGQLQTDRIATVFGSQMLYGPSSELLEAVKNSGDEALVCDIKRFGTTAMRDIMPLWMLKYLPNMAACHVGISLGATGPNNTLVSGDVSATAALIESVSVLRRGAADTVVCGATSSRIDETYMVYRGDAPMPLVPKDLATTSRPHSAAPSGIVLGEAAASLVVETRATAELRSALPLARITGYASRFGKPMDGTRGSADGIASAIRGALDMSKRRSAEIGLVVTHGTGDPERDAAEREALLSTVPHAMLVSPIAVAGHSGAASGALYLVTAVLSLFHGTIPQAPDHGPIHPAVASRFANSPEPLDGRAVLVITHTSHGVANAIVLDAG